MQIEQTDYVSIPTRDDARAVAWYRDILGLRESEFSSAVTTRECCCTAMATVAGSSRMPSSIAARGSARRLGSTMVACLRRSAARAELLSFCRTKAGIGFEERGGARWVALPVLAFGPRPL